MLANIRLSETEKEFKIRRNDERASMMVVHFPRLGFQLEKAPG
ncbi:MAG: hypothetical protein JWQ21_91 [Herminiimonas sp.]|nr:hypothetical protein [Herminiimonas sp.]